MKENSIFLPQTGHYAQERKLYVQVYHHRQGITNRKENCMYMYLTIDRTSRIAKRTLYTCISPKTWHYTQKREWYVHVYQHKEGITHIKRELYVHVYHHGQGITHRKEKFTNMYINIDRALCIL